MNTTIIIKNNDIERAVKEINKLRLANLNNWLFIQVEGLKETVLIKSFGTWLQVFKTTGGRRLAGVMYWWAI